MPEKGWSLLTVRSKTAMTVKELAKSKGLTVDKFINELLASSAQGSQSVWLTCSLCGTKVKAINISSHMAKMHPS